MKDSKKKTIMLSTLLLVFSIVVIILYSFAPSKELNAIDTFLVHFDSDGGTNVKAIEIEEGNSVNQPTTPTKEGYIFVGWMLGDELYDFNQEINDDVTLKAGWKAIEPDKKYYAVDFYTNDGSQIASQVIEENGFVTRPPTDPVKEGYTFNGWMINGEDYDFATPVQADFTLEARWEENPEEPEEPEENEEPEEKTYTVRFNANGGSLGSGCSAQSVKRGEKADNTCNASRSDYTFVGWSTTSTDTSIPSSRNITSRKINKNTTFYAIWRRNQSSPQNTPQTPPTPPTPSTPTYNVSFDLNGGTSSSCLTIGNGREVDEGTSLTSLCSNPTRSHYQFAGWYVGNTRYTTVTGRATYTARWNLNTFKVSCKTDDAMSGISCTLGLTENGKTVSNVTFYINGAAYSSIAVPLWNNLSSVEFKLSDGFSGTATK